MLIVRRTRRQWINLGLGHIVSILLIRDYTDVFSVSFHFIQPCSIMLIVCCMLYLRNPSHRTSENSEMTCKIFAISVIVSFQNLSEAWPPCTNHTCLVFRCVALWPSRTSRVSGFTRWSTSPRSTSAEWSPYCRWAAALDERDACLDGSVFSLWRWNLSLFALLFLVCNLFYHPQLLLLLMIYRAWR